MSAIMAVMGKRAQKPAARAAAAGLPGEVGTLQISRKGSHPPDFRLPRD